MCRLIRRFVLLTAVLLIYVAPLRAQDHCDCDISDSKRRAYDALLRLDADEKDEALRVHLPWGKPDEPAGATHEHLLVQREYVINYDDDLRIPIWVAYQLRKDDVEMRRERTECFRRDVRLESDDAAALCADYDEPVYDRGHMVPNADMTRSEAAMINTYMFTNMTPQQAQFNRGIWQRLESHVRDWAILKDEIYVVTGAVFDKDGDQHRDEDDDANRMSTHRVAVPTHYFKIIMYERPTGFIESMVFLLPHNNDSHTGKAAEKYLADHLTTIDEVERLTGMDFRVDERNGDEETAKEKAVERFKASVVWPTR